VTRNLRVLALTSHDWLMQEGATACREKRKADFRSKMK